TLARSAGRSPASERRCSAPRSSPNAPLATGKRAGNRCSRCRPAPRPPPRPRAAVRRRSCDLLEAQGRARRHDQHLARSDRHELGAERATRAIGPAAAQIPREEPAFVHPKLELLRRHPPELQARAFVAAHQRSLSELDLFTGVRPTIDGQPAAHPERALNADELVAQLEPPDGEALAELERHLFAGPPPPPSQK